MMTTFFIKNHCLQTVSESGILKVVYNSTCFNGRHIKSNIFNFSIPSFYTQTFIHTETVSEAFTIVTLWHESVIPPIILRKLLKVSFPEAFSDSASSCFRTLQTLRVFSSLTMIQSKLHSESSLCCNQSSPKIPSTQSFWSNKPFVRMPREDIAAIIVALYAVAAELQLHIGGLELNFLITVGSGSCFD